MFLIISRYIRISNVAITMITISEYRSYDKDNCCVIDYRYDTFLRFQTSDKRCFFDGFQLIVV